MADYAKYEEQTPLIQRFPNKIQVKDGSVVGNTPRTIITRPWFVVLVIFLAVCISVAVAVPLTLARTGDDHMDRALRILNEVPLIDGHNDLPYNIQVNSGGELSLIDLNRNTCGQFWRGPCQTDIPRMLQGKVGAQFWSVFTRCNTQYKDGVQKAMELADLIHRISTEYPVFTMAYTADDIVRAKQQNKIASLIGVEGGHMIGNSLPALRMLYLVGVRYLTLTWNCNTPWADQSRPERDLCTSSNGGLTSWGRQVVREMNRLGMLVDLSHVSNDTMMSALNESQAPVIFSHSSAYALCPHPRNVPDEVLRKVKTNGGIVMVNFYTKFINCTAENRFTSGPRSASIDQIIDHMNHIKSVAGVDHIGIGSDFDGIGYVPTDLEDTSKFPNLVAGMLRRGWPEADVRNVVGENLLRVMRRVEQVRDDMRDVRPYEKPLNYSLIPDRRCVVQPLTAPNTCTPGAQTVDAEPDALPCESL